jgi:uncharacterized protein with gpF-like domain
MTGHTHLDTKSAATDLRKKIALEKELLPKLDAYHRDLARLFIRSVNAGGVPSSVAAYNQQLEQLLASHYKRVQKQFDGALAERLPADVQPTGKEGEIITAALLAYFANQAREQADTINTTTDNDTRTALRLARQDAEEQGVAVSNTTLAVTGAAILQNQLRARALSIATTETQRAAEATKATEAEVLSGLTPTISRRITTPPRPETVPVKSWDSVGDSHVREAHLSADGQEVRTNEPFTVGGEQLMYPGDDSLGASIGNIVNCRCASVYNSREVTARRRDQR